MDVVLFSGGKDSLATALLLKAGKKDFRLVYNSYGYEPTFHWDYLEIISKRLGVEVDITKPKRNFFEIFKTAPTNNVPHCRQYIKISPLRDYLRENRVQKIYLGLRADEDRGCPKWDKRFSCPLKELGVGIAGVYRVIEAFNFDLHPLYQLGFSRVSCVPCPNWGKRDVLICLHYRWCKKLLLKVLDVVFSHHTEAWVRKKAVWYWRVYNIVRQKSLF